MLDHQDVLSALNGKLPLPAKLEYLHAFLKLRYGFIDRIAIALYDAKTDLLKTFVQHSTGENRLVIYSAKLSGSISLQEIVKTGRPRVVNDLDIYAHVEAEHARQIAAMKYESSYTLPIFMNGEFVGFLFFNSRRKNVFEERVLHYLDMLGHLVALLVIHEMALNRSLYAIVKTAANITLHRDVETGAHLDRMSNYARLIAKEVAGKFQLNDELVEHIFLFAPLHDIGKIGIPDSILLKPEKLTGEEFAIMQTHAAKGGEIINMMLSNLGEADYPHAAVLRNIALYHHEALDGSGYYGLKDKDIPFEAKIVSVADVFDALTSARSYKQAWSNDAAFAFLQSMAGIRFDADCVAALARCRAQVEEIQQRFGENRLG
ncbi:MAG: HD domain-containing protein [Nitrosomonadales bacterium]|nr:HD domain-containing protein [Nitrosomonadales bacterium]